MIPADLLRRIRNDLPMPVVIAHLGRDGPPSKLRDDRFVFLCPRCREMLTYVNPKNNLAHCFACGVNLNTIDLMQACGHDFRSAVALLERWLEQYQARRPTTNPCRERRFSDRVGITAIAFSRIQQNSGNLSSSGPNLYSPNSATNATTIRCATTKDGDGPDAGDGSRSSRIFRQR